MLVTPDDLKFDTWGRMARAYARCRELADVVDGEPAFSVTAESYTARHDPTTHEYRFGWEARVGADFVWGRVVVGRNFGLRQDVAERVMRLLEEAVVVMCKQRAASSAA